MEQGVFLKTSQYTRYLVPADSYEINGDKRLLIPFTDGDKIGFINRMGEIVVKPRYAICYGECYDETDFIRVAEIEAYGTGIVNLKTDNEMGDIFDLSGRKVKANSVSMKDLPKGIYIVNGKKVVVK